MKAIKLTALLLGAVFAAGSFAQTAPAPAKATPATTQKKIKDHRTQPDLFFLVEGQTANSLELLPPPPDMASIQFLYDKARYDWGKAQRKTERGEQAFQDARVSGDGVPKAFSEAFGIDITPESTPEIYKLIVGMREDAGDLATRDAKNYYNRVRPFAFFNEMTCNPEQQEELSTNGSYPSGHTSIGWATALGRQNPEALETYLAAVSPIAALSSFQSTGSRPALSAPAASPLSDEERFVCAQLGLSEAEYLAVRG